MRFGFYLPTRGPTATRDALLAITTHAESQGFDSVMIADHVVIPESVESAYPYTISGAFVGDEEAMEQLSLMSFVAAVTERMRIVASVMIVPQRNPVVTAKMLSTIDVLSNGRVTVGIGVGWLREEFEALKAADFAARGAVTDEYIDIFKTLWTQKRPRYDGEHYSFEALKFAPKPVQTPHPPIWVGGHSKPALRRVARLGDGWHPVGSTAASPLPPEEVREKRAFIHATAEALGRDPALIQTSYKAPIYDGGQPPAGAQRRYFSGSAQAIIDDIGAFADVGVDELVFDFRSETTERTLERMSWFAADVASAF
jgi:probable F420-dependent oxidoreductase